MTISTHVRPVAQFPNCPCCGVSIIDPVSDAEICAQVRDGPVHTIRKSEAAAYLRFLKGVAPSGAVTQDIYQALGACINVSRVIDTLRKKIGRENVPCDKRPKSNSSGSYGVYYLPEHVRVWEPEGEEG